MLILTSLLCLIGQVVSGQATDFHLSLGGARINNNSYVDIDSIGVINSITSTKALLCHTGSAGGDWYDSTDEVVEDNNTNAFVSDRNGTVIKLFRTNSSTEGGQFYCIANDTNQTLHVYILDIGAVTIFPPGPITSTSQKTISLNCLLNLSSSALPEDVPAPSLVWFFNSTDSSLPPGVIMSGTSNMSSNGITYTNTLHLSPSLESQTGTYICQIDEDERQSANTSIFIFSIQVSDGGAPPVVGQGYVLTCNVSTNVSSYRWRKDGITIPEEVEQSLIFNSLNLSNVGDYTCEVGVRYNNFTAENKSIILEIPAPLSVVVTSNNNNTNSVRPIGANITLTCKVELSPAVNVAVTVNTEWRGPAGLNMTNMAWHDADNASYSSMVTIFSFENIHSGDYTCTAEVVAMQVTLSQHLNNSRAISNETKITTGVYLFLKGKALTNNTVFNYTTQVDSADGLNEDNVQSGIINFPVCYTDKVNCCNTSIEGQWSFPTNTTQGAKDKFAMTRNDRGAVNLTYQDNEPPPQGTYCCSVPDANEINQRVCIHTAPVVSIDETNRILGENYTLTCHVFGITNPRYTWRKDGTLLNKMGPRLFFSPLRLSDAGLYTCFITDNYQDNEEVTITVPAPTFVTLMSDKLNPVRPNGLNIIVTLTCTMEFQSMTNLSELMVSVYFSKNTTILEEFSSANISNTTLMYTTQLDSFKRNDSGNYNCTVIVRPQQPSSHIFSSTITRITNISTGVYLSKNGTIITNDSEISIDTIGKENNEALLCFTDLYQFYPDASDIYEEVGQWYYPNNSAVEMNETIGDIYTSRDRGVVRLHRKNNVTMPTGLYICNILDSNLTNQSIYVRVVLHQNSEPTSTTPAVAAGAVVAGVVVCGLSGLLLIIAGSVLVVFKIRRLRARSKPPHQTSVFSEPLEAIDSTKLPPEPEDSGGECIELNEWDEIQADKDSENHFIDTTSTDGECMKSIPVSEFCSHVEQLHAERDKLFEMDYTRLSRLPKFCTSEAKLPHNIPKNRFANILPYDCSRVKLREIDGEEGSDYINANYLDGYNKPTAYIAAQGPLPNTVGDFWRMIWENKLSTIVMLTRCFEGRAKCEEYWPVNVGESVSPGHNLTITLTAMLPFTEYTIRKMKVTCLQPPEEYIYSNIDSSSLEVVQLHFTGWPDHGVPQNGVVLINFIRRVRIIHPYSDPCPLLVHCSAGVGRTGAFIVLDSMLERMKKENSLNIFEFLKQIRAQRVLMVQTQTQYIFIHDVLNELILSGDTEINAPNLRIIMNQLNKIRDGETGYSKQFKILDHVSPTPCEADYNHANMEYNIGKNRYPHIRPNDHYRVMLRELAGSGLDYINASFIDGYRQRGTYIATQIPMENTVNDFWKMVWEYKSKSIVVLCKLTEDGEIYHNFLPETKGSSLTYGKVQVKFISKKIATDYIIKQVELSEDRGTDKHEEMTVTVFHYLRWPKSESPQRTASLLEVIEQVNKKQMSTGNKAITVMCNDGVGRTGTFICIHTQLERLKTEGVVDFFQSIKSARIQRAGFVPEVHQYALCHTVVADFLDDFDAYANFKELI